MRKLASVRPSMKASLLLSGVLILANYASAEEDPFEVLDAQLEAQFGDTDDTLEANFLALDAALEAGFKQLESEVQAVWGKDDAVLPSRDIWVDYSENKRLRRQFDFARGLLIVEQVVAEDEDIANVSADIETAIRAAQIDTPSDLADKDDALIYASARLAADGLAFEQAVEDGITPVLGEALPVSADQLKQLSAVISETSNSLKEAAASPSSLVAAEQMIAAIPSVTPADAEGASQPISEDDGAQAKTSSGELSEPNPSPDPTAGISNTVELAAVTDGPEGSDSPALNMVQSSEDLELNEKTAPAISGTGADGKVDLSTKPVDSILAKVESLDGDRQKVTVTIPLRADFLTERARQYRPAIEEEADRRQLPVSLIYAIMETESHFNPRARSHIPAFGLMQLVPKSGGLDAYHYVYGEKKLLGPEYFFEPDQNVELGTAYLDLLYRRYLRAITDDQSRLYCTIAAYNTGAGNVARAFTGGTSVSSAAAKINTLSPEAVYEHLLANLPYVETRNYLEKVRIAQEKYETMEQSAIL